MRAVETITRLLQTPAVRAEEFSVDRKAVGQVYRESPCRLPSPGGRPSKNADH